MESDRISEIAKASFFFFLKEESRVGWIDVSRITWRHSHCCPSEAESLGLIDDTRRPALCFARQWSASSLSILITRWPTSRRKRVSKRGRPSILPPLSYSADNRMNKIWMLRGAFRVGIVTSFNDPFTKQSSDLLDRASQQMRSSHLSFHLLVQMSTAMKG